MSLRAVVAGGLLLSGCAYLNTFKGSPEGGPSRECLPFVAQLSMDTGVVCIERGGEGRPYAMEIGDVTISVPEVYLGDLLVQFGDSRDVMYMVCAEGLRHGNVAMKDEDRARGITLACGDALYEFLVGGMR